MIKKIFFKCLLCFLGILVLLVLLVVIAFNVSPKPGALIIRHMFDSEVQVTDSENYQKAKKNVIQIKDQHYTSRFKENTYDVYIPKSSEGVLPVLFWIHGGGFVAGDKKGTEEFATRLASDAHIAIVSMNYEPAPESAYPNQLFQVSELVDSLKKEKIKELDLTKIMFGGDSAGSQIALQFVVTQTNENYRQSVGISRSLEKDVLKGAISYCGPVNLKQMVDMQSSNQFMKFFVKTVAWSEIGTRNWQTSPKLEEISLVSHLTPDFPPTYITDGNAFSFQDQGITFEKKLQELKVPVRGLFYKESKKEISHEYQFDYTLQEAKECYQQTVDFVNNYKNK